MVSDEVKVCNAADRCKNPAVMQAEVTCSGCTATDDEVAVRLASKQAQVDYHVGVVEYVRAHVEATDTVGQMAVQAGEQRGEDLRAELAALTAHYEEVCRGHTHPLFMCETHLKKKG